MCEPGQPSARPVPGAVPGTAADAVAMAMAGLAFLASADVASFPAAALADCLRALERAGSVHTAARSRFLAAFGGQRGYEDDGQGSPGAWLRWQTRITKAAAAGAVGWARRLAAHPAVRDTLAAGNISASWAREICGWSDRLPEAKRADADEVLLGAAAGGAELADLAGLAEEMYRRCAPADSDDDDGFTDRWLRLDRTFRGAGRVAGDLTPQCTAALRAVLEALGKKAGPEDVRTQGQRDHDALEEACRRLAGAGCLPDRAGQSTQIQLHMTLDQLRGLPGAPDAEAAWAARGPAAAPGAECDASIVPVVSGHVDPAILDQLVAALRGAGVPLPAGSVHSPGFPRAPGSPLLPGSAALSGAPLLPGTQGPSGSPWLPGAPGFSRLPGAPAGSGAPWLPGSPGLAGASEFPGIPGLPSSPGPYGAPGLPALARSVRPPGSPAVPSATATVRALVLRHAADLLSGPAGLAAFLRTGLLDGAAGSISLPLDVGRATEEIPPHLRRAVIARDQGCGFPGCTQPPEVCQVHHLIPRAQGGPTRLDSLILGCTFHHLIAVHRWGWRLALHPDGTVTAISPDGHRILRSHGPPARAA